MEETFSLLGRLAAGVAHDMRNYLAVADGWLSMLQGHEDAAELREARRALEGALRLTRSLLSYTGTRAQEPQQVDLAELTARVLHTFRGAVPPGVEQVIAIDTGTGAIHGLEAEIEQLVLNLVLNACAAMPWGGRLSVSVQAVSAGAVSLEVADTGRGSGLAQAASGGSPQPRGYGLGLGIVRAVAERHGAHLYFGHSGPGGTRVVVTFARRQALPMLDRGPQAAR